MKKIEAIIRPEKLEEVKNAIADYGISGITITNILGAGNQKGYTQIYRGQEVVTRLLPKLKIEIVTSDTQVDQIIDIIVKNARTGKVGDGKIFISNIDEVVRIRTGEWGNDAL